ncbi:hypothetical protein [Mycobacterium sp.]|uniref:hypothetical protein n=1 Tax=Mycobacterium sp. TaxID=1785 RepID=UPI002CA3B66E|nr:hypothetical protein [Mycobacterium sp.]HTQ20132.1 hypothetical protein [Mycobacterium sp.]
MKTVVPRSRPSPRLLGAAALAVIGACGVALVVAPPQTGPGTNLASRSNWALANALPRSGDFPADWGYGVSAPLRRATRPEAVASSSPSRPGPAPAYTPAACGSIPKILDHSGGALAAYLQVDRYTQLFVQDADPADGPATGETHEHGPNSRIAIWAASDGPARIANYLDWLGRCGSYHVTNYYNGGRVKNERTVSTEIQTRSASGADAAAIVTRTFSTIGSRDPSSSYQVVYYAVPGVLVECTIYMEGADVDVVKHAAAQTLERLRAL